MAYNNFPVGYQPAQTYYPNAYNASASWNQPQSNGSIIWVQGEAGAKSYLVAPNNTVQLWDSENQVIYLKSADASGMPSMKILDYKIRKSSQPVQNQVVNANQDFITREELNAFENKIHEQILKIVKEE